MKEVMEEKNISFVDMPAMALRGLTVFPGMVVNFEVGRKASIKALNKAMEEKEQLFLVTQRDISVEDPERGDLFSTGTVAAVKQILRLPGDNVRVLVEGLHRASLWQLTQLRPHMVARVRELPQYQAEKDDPRVEAVLRQCYELFQEYAELAPKMSPELMLTVIAASDPGYLADYIAQHIPIRGEDKQDLLDELRPVRRLEMLNGILHRENQVLAIQREMESKYQEHMSSVQRDYYLREQMKVLQNELGEGDSDSELFEYSEKIEAARLPQEVADKLNKELRRLSKQPFGSAEASVIRNYLDVCLELPWNKYTKERINVAAARKVLDADHYGLEKVKERILEFLAVRKLSPDLGGQIICLAGPPGVGKTSIAASLARAMNRKMARVSLGGVRDEAEIRGHRKTYVGSMPGRIIEAVRKAGSRNPLILLDEIDKLGSDYKGDPASALLEVLDAEQNSTFRDHFLELPFDLSDVMFITTANDLGTVPRPLLDRMEVIELSSYTDEEKLQIARNHLLPREMKRHGLDGRKFRVSDSAIREMISGYTMEAGVRQLERKLAAICRKGVMQLVEGDVKRVTITDDDLEKLLGVRRYHHEKRSLQPQVGVVNGLAWTAVGGELLEVEVNVLNGTGKVEPTGNLGDVMRESCHAAVSYIRSKVEKFGIAPDFYQKKDIHIHFPEGAVPKDGPSAGVTVTTAIVSALTGIPVKGDVCMTGEVTLRGRVLAIGGLKEKTMAAYRSGMKTVVIPADNEKDLPEIDQTVRAALRFVTAEQVDEVLAEALVKLPETVRGSEHAVETILPTETKSNSIGIQQ